MKWAKVLKFLFPFAMWVIIFRGYLSGMPTPDEHGSDYYRIIKYFMENMMRGVFSFWNPFLSWGYVDGLDARFIGEFNPFLWFYAFFKWAGFSPALAYNYYTFLYFFVGMWGFYLIAKKFLKNSNFAFLGFTALVYSSVFLMVMNNYCIILILVPSIWFFYFLTAFFLSPQKRYFLGLVFSSMIIAITYLPFYFLIVLISVLFWVVVFYARDLPQVIGRAWRFLKERKIFSVFCIVCLCVSLIPGILWYKAASKGEYVASYRQEGTGSENTAVLTYEKVETGSIVGHTSFRKLFADLDKDSPLMVFFPVLVYLWIFLGMFNSLNRRLWFLAGSSFFVFVLCLVDITPVYRFLFDHVFIFRMFRNTFYLVYFIMPFFVLFAVEQVKKIMDLDPILPGRRRLLILYLVLMHMLFLLFLWRVGDIIITSYIAVIGSMLFFVLYFATPLRKKTEIWMILLLGLLMIQPAEVFHHFFKKNFGVPWNPVESFEPRFSFVRREEMQEDSFIKGDMRPIQDASGIVEWKYTGQKYSYLLHENIEHSVLRKYTHYKFYVYDYVKVIPEEKIDFSVVERALAQRESAALVFNASGLPESALDLESPGLAQPVAGNSDKFEVEAFDLNHLKFQTKFTEPKFLVYTDSFESGWRAKINGEPATVYQANVAFKGLWLPAGKNTVELRFGSWGLYAYYCFMLVFFMGFFVYFLWTCRKEKRAQFLDRGKH